MPDAQLSRVVSFGAGGAGAAVGYALLELGAGQLSSLRSSTATRAASTGARLRRAATTPRQCGQLTPESALARADGLVNTTPVGMAKYPGQPIDRAA